MNTIDSLMERVSEINAKPANVLEKDDLMILVEYHRFTRAQRQRGIKAKPPTMANAEIADLRAQLLASQPPAETKKGSTSGLRGRI